MHLFFNNFFILNIQNKNFTFIFAHDNHSISTTEKEFLCPCKDFNTLTSGIYVIVFTDLDGNKQYLFVQLLNDEGLALIIKSNKPWWDLHYSFMEMIVEHKLYKETDLLINYLNSFYDCPSAKEGLVFYLNAVNICEPAKTIKIPASKRIKPFLGHLKDYYKLLPFSQWIIIFESLLLEKWIIFHSDNLSRVTNCLFAALSFIFPLEWVHLLFPCLSEHSINCLGCPSPFVAGIHSCLLEKCLSWLNPGTVIVDIDKGEVNFVTIDYDEHSTSNGVDDSNSDHLPRPLVNLIHRSYLELLPSASCSSTSSSDSNLELAFNKISKIFLNCIAILIGEYQRYKVWDEARLKFVIDKSALANHRPQFSYFVKQMLESQTVYQYIDFQINNDDEEDGKKNTFILDSVDDFADSIVGVARWQPDHYTERLANFASKSTQKMNVFSDRVQKSVLIKKSPSPNKKITLPLSSTSQIKERTLSNLNVDEIGTIADGFVVEIPPANSIPQKCWIKFEEDDLDIPNYVDADSDDVNENEMMNRNEVTINPNKSNVVHADEIRFDSDGFNDLMRFNDTDQECFNQNKVPSIIQDFDPLFNTNIR